jgi:demethylmenaquinone methyltransferase / 2-methoxy-6-polyprenyl-1,4-benzoquinol methylase
MHSRPAVARRLFAPIAADYERWARILSVGQDGRWRRAMVAGLGVPGGSLILDLAAGTGSISRELAGRGHRVIAADQSPEMVAAGAFPGPVVQATAERLPFADGVFDAVTFGYLVRYVDAVAGLLAEVARVVRPGGRVGMVEFGLPGGMVRPLWLLHTRVVLPVAGRIIGHGWREVGRFLAGSIEDFARSHPPHHLAGVWRDAGLVEVRHRPMSLGGGSIMWGTRR